MLSLKKILAPVDFSERSAAAAEHAVVMAKHFDSEVIFQHVLPPGPYEHGFFEGGYTPSAVWPNHEEIEARVREQIEALAKKTSPDRRVECVVSWGEPVAKIEELAEHEGVDLLMMPTHGYGPFRRFILGSVTAKVLHDLSCPVFTGVHVAELPESAADPYEVVACALDLSEHSETVLRWAWDFAQAWNAALHVIHAAPTLDASPVDGQYFPANLRDTVVRLKTDQAQKLLDKVGAKATIHVECENVAPYVEQVAKGFAADTLIIGRSPAGGGLVGRLRGDAYALIREAPCPVISI
jgi:nucleotide-binding universal stress UspA family protein